MQLSIDKGFAERLKARFGKYDIQVGILKDTEYKKPKRGVKGLKGKDVIGRYAGGPVRKTSRFSSGQTVAQVSSENRKRLGFNYLSKPFKQRSSAIVKFSNEFFKMAFGRSEPRRAENLLQAVVRNPILRGDYGPNTEITKKIKGFDRAMMDTAQLFKNIKAKIVKRRR